MLAGVIERASGLLLHMPHHRATERVITLPNGKRARITVDDSGTVKHIEDNDSLSAVVRPRTTVIKIRGTNQ
jgi:hypothetical protein